MGQQYLDELVQNITTRCDLGGFRDLSEATEDAIKKARSLARAYRKAMSGEQKIELEALILAQKKSAEVTSWNAVLKEKERAAIYKSNEAISWNNYLKAKNNNETKIAYQETARKLAQDRKETADLYLKNSEVRKEIQLSKEKTAAMKKQTQEMKRQAKQVNVLGGLFRRVFFTYFGIHTVKNIIDNYRALDLTRKSIEGLTKSTQDWDYVQKEAFRTGTGIETVAKGYRNFYAAANTAGFGKTEIQGMYSGILTSARAIGATQPQIQSILLAFDQMLSKGKLSAEELRRQLSNALPAAFELGSEAMQMTTMQLDEALRKGLISSKEFVPKMIKTMLGAYGEGFENATKSLDFALVNLNTAWKLLNHELLTGETGKEFANTITMFTNILRSNEMKKFISVTSKFLNMVNKSIGWIIKNLDFIIMTLLAGGIVKYTGYILMQLSLLKLNLKSSVLYTTLVEKGFWASSKAAWGMIKPLMASMSWFLAILAVLMIIQDVWMAMTNPNAKTLTGMFADKKPTDPEAKKAIENTMPFMGAVGGAALGGIMGIGGLQGAALGFAINKGNQQVSKMGINPMTISPYGAAMPYGYGGYNGVYNKAETNTTNINIGDINISSSATDAKQVANEVQNQLVALFVGQQINDGVTMA